MNARLVHDFTRNSLCNAHAHKIDARMKAKRRRRGKSLGMRLAQLAMSAYAGQYIKTAHRSLNHFCIRVCIDIQKVF